jgi:hypothetical protein
MSCTHPQSGFHLEKSFEHPCVISYNQNMQQLLEESEQTSTS